MILWFGLAFSPFGGEFSSDAQRLPSRRDGNRVGDEGKAVGSAQAPAALLSFHNAMSRSVITITEFAVSRSQKPVQGLRTNSGSLAIFAAIRRARPDVTPDAAPYRASTMKQSALPQERPEFPCFPPLIINKLRFAWARGFLCGQFSPAPCYAQRPCRPAPNIPTAISLMATSL
jgi:hypothetical protein